MASVKASGVYWSEYEAFLHLDRTRIWSARRMVLEDNYSPVVTHDISTVSWLWAPEDETVFWPRPPSGRGRRRRRHGASGSADDVLKDGSDNEKSSSDDGTAKGSHSDSDDGDGGPKPPDWEIEIDKMLEELEDLHKREGGGICPVPDPGLPDVAAPDPVAAPPVPAAAAPDPPAPLAPPIRRRGVGVRGGPRYEHLKVYSAAGRELGFVLVNEHGRSLDCHCLLHGDRCRVGRQWEAYEGGGRLTPLRTSQGRPLGWLVAWLRLGERFEAGDGGSASWR